MGRKRTRAPDGHQQGPTDLSAGPSRWYFIAACFGAYVAIAALFWSTLQLAPISLDDQNQLQELALQPFTRVFGYDHFGYMRPVKSALFWALARSPEAIEVWRLALLSVFLASVVLGQVFCTTLLRSRWWGLLAIVCWALNPTTLSTLCWLSTANLAIAQLAVFAYLLLAERAVRLDETPRIANLAAIGAVSSLQFAVLSYQLAVVAPVLWFVQRHSIVVPRASRRRVVVLAVGSFACLLVMIFLHVSQQAPTIDYRFARNPHWLLVLSAPRYLAENLRLWLWLPGRFGVLLADEPAQHVWASVASWCVMIAACALAWKWRQHDRMVGLPLFWCAALLVPLMNFVPIGNTPIAMHYLYLPGFGLALLLARAAQFATSALRRTQRVWVAWSPALLLGCLIVAWLPEERRVAEAWADARTLYARTIHNYPGNIEARVNLTAIHLDAQEYAKADELLVESLRLEPTNFGLLSNRFRLLASLGRVQEALALQDAHPELNTPEYLVPRGMLLEKQGRHDDAAKVFQQAFDAAVRPDDRFAAGYHLAMSLVRTERNLQAELLIDRLLTEFPGRPELVYSKRLLANQH
jgi:hypothetical protein